MNLEYIPQRFQPTPLSELWPSVARKNAMRKQCAVLYPKGPCGCPCAKREGCILAEKEDDNVKDTGR